MSTGELIFLGFILFIIIFGAVRLAIGPLIDAVEADEKSIDESGLTNLGNIGVLSEKELNDVIQIFYNKGYENREYETYLKYAKVLNELKETNYFKEEAFNEKMEKLKNYYGVK